MTAAHCVRRGSSPGTTHILMVFVPGYSKGKMPYGAFAVRRDPAQLGDGLPPTTCDGVVRAAAPVVLTALCLHGGKSGWVVLGVVLALCGLATRPLTRWALRTRTFPAPEAVLPVG